MSLGGSDKPSSSTGTQQTQYERALAEKAAADWNDYVTRFPMVEDTITRLTSNTAQRRQRAMADASAIGMEQSGFGARAVADSGRPANSGPVMRDMTDRANVFRRGLGAAAGATEPALYEMKQRGRLSVASSLRGLEDAAQLSMGQLAQDATRDAIITAQNRMTARNAWAEGLANAAGMYAGYKMPINSRPVPGAVS